jgi:hypothetical protein
MHRVVAVVMVVSCLAGMGIVLASLGTFKVSVLAIPLLAGLSVMTVRSARQLTQSPHHAQYVLRRSLPFYLLLGGLALAGAIYAVAASELAMIGIYLVLLSHGVFAVYKKVDKPR